MASALTVEQIAQRLTKRPGWKAVDSTSISRGFQFPDHVTAMGFVVRVAMAAEVLNHHPDLRIVYNRVEIVLSTHDAGGVSEKDFELAEKIDTYV